MALFIVINVTAVDISEEKNSLKRKPLSLKRENREKV